MTIKQMSDSFKVSEICIHEAIDALRMPSKRGRGGYDYTEEQLKQIRKQALIIDRKKRAKSAERKQIADERDKKLEEESQPDIFTKEENIENEARLVSEFTIEDDDQDSIFDILEEIEDSCGDTDQENDDSESIEEGDDSDE